MSVIEEYFIDTGANSRPVPILSLAGTSRAHCKEIMALAFRSLLWIIVLLAPGGFLLLPILALHQVKSSRVSNTANEH
jgi:hypothetical protein